MNTTTEKLLVSYWNDNAKFSKEFSKLTEDLMPAQGEGETVEAELIRIANRYYWDYCNNGNMNLLQIDYKEVDNGYYEEVYNEETEEYDEEWVEDYEEEAMGSYISPYYAPMLELVSSTIQTERAKEACLDLEDLIIKMEHDCQFNQKEYNVYNEFVDVIVEYVLAKNGNYTPFNGYDTI